MGKFKSYRMVIAAVETLTWKGMSGIIASIGNLIAEEDEQSIYRVHKRLFFLNFWMVSFIIISLFNTLNQFIVLWLGVDQLIDSLTFVVILVNCYFSLMRSSVESFKEERGFIMRSLCSISRVYYKLSCIDYLSTMDWFTRGILRNND